MIAWARSMIGAAVIFPTLSLIVFASMVALAQHSITATPRPTGVFWICRYPVLFHPESVMPPQRKTKIKEGEVGTDTAKKVAIWNQNRSGDLFAAMILSLAFCWMVLQFLRHLPVKL